MRIVCLERDNVTQLSEPDSNNNVYTASFELYPFYEGAAYSCFKGLMNGNGPLCGRFCVVRAMLDTVAEEMNWFDIIRRTTEAQRLAKEFNKVMGYTAITFQTPLLTQIDTLSDFACLFRCFNPHDKRLKHGEYVTIEPFLDGQFLKFDSQIGSTAAQTAFKSKNRECIHADNTSHRFGESNTSVGVHRTNSNATSITEAFCHFTWHFTRKLIVSSLQGVSDGYSYRLTNPSIHSTDSQFGFSDGSLFSIAEFFSSHRCNNICCHWETCGSTGKPQSHVNFFHKPDIL